MKASRVSVLGFIDIVRAASSLIVLHGIGLAFLPRLSGGGGPRVARWRGPSRQRSPPPCFAWSMCRSPCPPDRAAARGASRTCASPANAGEDRHGAAAHVDKG